MTLLRSVIILGMGILLLMNPLSITATQSETLKLKYGTTFGATHPFSKADSAWIKKMEAETQGRIQIQPFWGGTLINPREAIEQVKNGVTDIAFIVPGYASAGFPIAKSMMGMFYGIDDAEKALNIYLQVYDDFPDMSGEFKDVKVLAICAAEPYQLMTRKKAVRTVEDLKGLRLKCPSAFAKAFKDLGAEGVLMPMSEAYISMEKGLLDGVFAPTEALKSMRFAEVVDYVTTGIGCIPAPFPKRAMNMKVWNKLPADIQEVFDKNSEFWSKEEMKQMVAAEQGGIDLAKKNGVEFIKLPPDELVKLTAVMEKYAMEDAAKLDAQGYKSSEMLKEIRKLSN